MRFVSVIGHPVLISWEYDGWCLGNIILPQIIEKIATFLPRVHFFLVKPASPGMRACWGGRALVPMHILHRNQTAPKDWTFSRLTEDAEASSKMTPHPCIKSLRLTPKTMGMIFRSRIGSPPGGQPSLTKMRSVNSLAIKARSAIDPEDPEDVPNLQNHNSLVNSSISWPICWPIRHPFFSHPSTRIRSKVSNITLATVSLLVDVFSSQVKFSPGFCWLIEEQNEYLQVFRNLKWIKVCKGPKTQKRDLFGPIQIGTASHVSRSMAWFCLESGLYS